jgi:hypothetical protein
MLIAIKKPSGFCSAAKLEVCALFESTQPVMANGRKSNDSSLEKTISGGLRNKQMSIWGISEFATANFNRKKFNQ